MLVGAWRNSLIIACCVKLADFGAWLWLFETCADVFFSRLHEQQVVPFQSHGAAVGFDLDASPNWHLLGLTASSWTWASSSSFCLCSSASWRRGRGACFAV